MPLLLCKFELWSLVKIYKGDIKEDFRNLEDACSAHDCIDDVDFMQTCATSTIASMITLEDIARQVGVSHSTVSRALAGSPLVNKETAERIRKAAQEAGYQVNQIARNLKTRSTRTIGLIVPEVSNPYYPKVIQQIADRVRDAGYMLQLHLSGSDQAAEESCLTSLRENRADGVLLVTGERGITGLSQVNELVRAKVPIVLLGWVEGAEHVDMVTGDDAAGGYALAQHLLQLGHRRIAVLGKPKHRGRFDRMEGFAQGLTDAGYPLAEDLIVQANSPEEVNAGVQMLLGLIDRPTAIFAYQDSIALQVYKALANAGVPIPSGMSVVGFDDLELASLVTPPLTTVGKHIEPLVQEFVDCMFDLIANRQEPRPPELVIVTPEIIVRGSTATLL